MKKPISLEANPRLTRQYQDLLTQEWSEATLVGVLELLTDQLPVGERERFVEVTEPFKILRMFSKFLPLAVTKSASRSDRRPRARNNPSEQIVVDRVERTCAFLLFKLAYAIEGECALFVDSQSLLYLCVVHFLLPTLDSKQMVGERNSLVSALALHSLTWDSNLPHMLYLRSVLFHYLDQTSNEIDALVESFRLTDPDDHDYVTKAQAAWMSMLNDHQIAKAKEFMLEVYRNCSLDARAEVREILDETYALVDVEASLPKTS